MGVVEVGERDREGEQDQEVQVQQAQGFAPVEERHEEQEAERDPDVERVDVAPESAGIAARHRPSDLKAGPLFEHFAVVVGDDHLADLLALFGEVADLPAHWALQIGAPVGARVFGAHRLHLGQAVGDFEDLVRGQMAPHRRHVGRFDRYRRFRVGGRRGRCRTGSGRLRGALLPEDHRGFFFGPSIVPGSDRGQGGA